MHATHQFFLTKRSLYLLVLDSRLDEKENRVEYWLKIIQSFGGDSPIIVVCNKNDEHDLELDWRGLQNKYPAIKAFAKKVSCKTGDGIAELRELIGRETGQHCRYLPGHATPAERYGGGRRRQRRGRHARLHVAGEHAERLDDGIRQGRGQRRE